MKINFTARHTEISPDMKEYCEKRLLSIEKVLDYSVAADLILSVEKYRHKADHQHGSGEIHLPGELYR